MFSEEAITLAKPCYEAIKKISKRGINPMTGALLTIPKWEWEPEVGERCIYSPNRKIYAGQAVGKIGLVWPHDASFYNNKKIEVIFGDGLSLYTKIDEFIPLLHWEKIEEILEGMRYEIRIDREYTYYSPATGDGEGYKQCFCKIGKLPNSIIVTAKTRQEAIQGAVIKLRKGI